MVAGRAASAYWLWWLPLTIYAESLKSVRLGAIKFSVLLTNSMGCPGDVEKPLRTGDFVGDGAEGREAAAFILEALFEDGHRLGVASRGTV